ncbi:hypothetical protein ZOD2009_19138 [Haladaptatus paucihalophilus DX253]|uniref:Uncharacterized protein n=1 Tax=Haladaptatus paucihalophilus DX253 TaxID=797209 RepID=E7QYD7_HALPU|nr:hypothetical protein [Haladaptatus paucihalophilus]EFW90462.1 hypothetical protein ZOD2009_19138 [Haladaptatus paucihalophilus DX253]SHL67983.1 hypothetical protein SAMN05444342_4390 [Haladaptatus paucihalophilus DX253]
MGKLEVAMKLSDELGVTAAKAMRYIDDVGLSTAAKSLDEAAKLGDEAVEIGWKPIAAVGSVGAIGSGALIWQHQDVQKAKAIAGQKQAASDTLSNIVDSDLPPSLKQEMANQFLKTQTPDSNDSNGASGGLFDDMQTTIVALVVLAFVLKFTLGDE